MITIKEFEQSQCSTQEWWYKHNFDKVIQMEDEGGEYNEYYTIKSAVEILNYLNPHKTIEEWEQS